MTPKIRGVAPAMRRYKKPDLGVKSPKKGHRESGGSDKRLQKGHKEPDLSAQKLQIGDAVEVRLEEGGLHGSWHSAVICGIKQGLRHVKFRNLFDSKNNSVKEWVRFGNEGPLGSRKVSDNKPVLRPGGPGLPPLEPSFRKTGGWPKDLWVEVYSEEAWWEGVLLEDISAAQMNEEESVVDVIFPQLDDIVEQVTLKNLRECKDWNELTGVWTIRGRRVKEDDPISQTPGSPVCKRVTSPRQDEESSHVEVKHCDGMGDKDLDNLKEGAHDPLPSSGQVRSVQANTGLNNKAFGSLIAVVEKERHFLVRVQALAYTLEQIRINVDERVLHIRVTSDSTQEIGGFSCEVSSSSLLEFPSDVVVDEKKISWELHDEILTLTVPWVDGEGTSN